jgi:hypothetical protein
MPDDIATRIQARYKEFCSYRSEVSASMDAFAQHLMNFYPQDAVIVLSNYLPVYLTTLKEDDSGDRIRYEDV